MTTKVSKAFEARLRRQLAGNPSLAQQTQNISSAAYRRFYAATKGCKFYDFSLEPEKHRELYASNLCKCFVCQIGWPQKNGIEYFCFDYERYVLEKLGLDNNDKFSASTLLNKKRNVGILKATGLGISWLCLGWIMYRCVYDSRWKGGQVCIVVGPNHSMTIQMVDRMKHMLQRKLGLTFSTKETVLKLGGVHIECFPSNHIDSMRALPEVKMVYVSETSFIGSGLAKDVLDVTLRYGMKSRAQVIYESTPRAAEDGDIMWQIFEKPDSAVSQVFEKVRLDYTVGIGKIYDNDLIQEQMLTPGWRREYLTEFTGVIGNVFTPQSIDRAISDNYSIEGIPAAPKALGIDSSLGARTL
jgi:hypothetical protein